MERIKKMIEINSIGNLSNIGYFKGETCNRNGCNGIIEATEKEGCCSCHISAPCSYCTQQTEYCPVCGWSAEDEQYEYDKKIQKSYRPIHYEHLTEKEMFDRLKNGEFGYINIYLGTSIAAKLKGKHPNMTRKQILEKLGFSENPEMPRFSILTDTEFELTYLSD